MRRNAAWVRLQNQVHRISLHIILIQLLREKKKIKNFKIASVYKDKNINHYLGCLSCVSFLFWPQWLAKTVGFTDFFIRSRNSWQ